MKKILIVISLFYELSFAFGFSHHHRRCIYIKQVSCASIIVNMETAKELIKTNYKLMDKLMAINMNNVKMNEKTILQKQKNIQILITQIKKIQKLIAIQEAKKVFLLKKIKKLNLYKGDNK